MNAKSKTPRIALIVIITTITILVRLQASEGVGQVTLRSSPMVSRHHLVIALVFFPVFLFFSGIFISQLCLKRRRVLWRRYSFISRPGRNRTHSLLFWRQALCQLSYWPILLCGCGEKISASALQSPKLLRLLMQSMLFAAGAVFLYFYTAGIIAPIFFGCVVAFFTFLAR